MIELIEPPAHHADEDHGVLRQQAPERARAPPERQQGALLLGGGQVGLLRLKEAEHEAHSPGIVRTRYARPCSSNAAREIQNSKLQMPERILDAPELVNDYYLNLLDWSADNRLAVALGADVYLWNAGNKIWFMIGRFV